MSGYCEICGRRRITGRKYCYLHRNWGKFNSPREPSLFDKNQIAFIIIGIGILLLLIFVVIGIAMDKAKNKIPDFKANCLVLWKNQGNLENINNTKVINDVVVSEALMKNINTGLLEPVICHCQKNQNGAYSSACSVK